MSNDKENQSPAGVGVTLNTSERVVNTQGVLRNHSPALRGKMFEKEIADKIMFELGERLLKRRMSGESWNTEMIKQETRQAIQETLKSCQKKFDDFVKRIKKKKKIDITCYVMNWCQRCRDITYGFVKNCPCWKCGGGTSFLCDENREHKQAIQDRYFRIFNEFIDNAVKELEGGK